MFLSAAQRAAVGVRRRELPVGLGDEPFDTEALEHRAKGRQIRGPGAKAHFHHDPESRIEDLQNERCFRLWRLNVIPIHSAHGIRDAEKDHSQNTSHSRPREQIRVKKIGYSVFGALIDEETYMHPRTKIDAVPHFLCFGICSPRI